LDGLADAASDGERRLREPDLFATLDARGAPPPDPAVWHKARRDLGQAQIGTLHSLCAQLLRRHAASAGLDPAFDLLDELESRALLRESCERAVLNALDGDGPARAAAERLVGEWNYRGQSKFVRGLADELEVLARLLAESGTTPAELVRAAPALDVEAALTAELAARRRLANALEELALAVRQSGSSSQTAQRWLEAAGAFAGVRDRVLACAPGELRAIWPLLEPVEAGVYAALHTKAGALKDAQVEARAAFEHLVACEADVRASRLAPELTLLSDRALALHADEKARAGVLEFDDLTRRARELLASRPEVRAAEQARFGAILVDEFQDTSRGQLDLLRHLAGAFAEGGRRLLVVGDWKQSIYEFRGADLSGVRGFAEGALRSGAEAFALRDSRRSMPALVDACNQLFQGVLGQGTEPFEAPFRPGTDDLVAVRQTRADAPRVELLSYEASASTLKGAPLEADSVARRIAALLTPEAPERVYDRRADGTEDARAPRGGDVAILLRSLTHIDDYRRALLRWRIPHVLFKGRGFHQTREVLDLRALLSLLFDDRDEAAIATVLRSPLGPLSDDALAILALTPKADEPPPEKPRPGRLRLPRLRDPLVLEQLAPDDRACAERLWSLIQRLRRASARLGPAALLEAALTETDYVASLGGGLFGEQAAANIGKLLDLARAVERKGGGVRDLLNRLDLLDDEVAGEPEAPVTEQTDPHAVRILTVHASKGLEFPIVVVPDCGAPSPNLQNRVLLDPDLGLALKVRTLTGKPGFGAAGGRVDQRRKAREQAESRRLLYVAATRARDLLVLSGLPARQPCWRTWLDAHLPQDPALVRRIACDDLPRLQSQSRRAPIETIEELEALESPPAQARPPPGV
ncbi:MAG: UvrD-helicase domain-containing protein, partial [Deltaproteobacteria bacterium]|nr:UvrD-helicase domain-containing protein [Deltaproteobacteria bacterium]